MIKMKIINIIYIPMMLFIIPLIFLSCDKNVPIPKPYSAPKDAKIQLRGDIVFLTATALAQKIRTGELTSLEVVEAHLSQIYAFNPQLNSIVTVNATNALKRAREADKSLAEGIIWGPLHGVPVTFKDHYATKSIRTTSGFYPLAQFVPDFDATVVARMKNAGAIILGKTNMPPMGMDTQTDNPIFGTTNNPWDLERTPGGSSGGSAAAVAAGLSPLGMGSDIGGSIRLPSHFTGIFGFKPTENMISNFGTEMPGIDKIYPELELKAIRHLLSLGPLARSVEDLKLAFSVIAGADPNDINAPEIPVIYPEPKPLQTLRIAWTDSFPGATVSKEVYAAMNALIKKLKEKGIIVEKTNPPGFNFNNAWETWGNLMDMESGVYTPSLIRFISFITKSKKFQVYPFSHKKYLSILTRRDRLISEMEFFLSRYDAWLCPVSQIPAFRHIVPDKRWAGLFPVYREEINIDGTSVDYWAANLAYTIILNLTGNPVVVMPIGHTESGLPIGVQVVGSRWEDARLLTVAEQLNKVGGNFLHPPGYKK